MIACQTGKALKIGKHILMDTYYVNFLSMVGVCTAALATVAGVVVAICALNTWRKQYVETLKGNLIASLVDYSTTLPYLPNVISSDDPNRMVHIGRIAGAFYVYQRAWAVLKTTLMKNEKDHDKLLSSWKDDMSKFLDLHNGYMNGTIQSGDLRKYVDEICYKKRK